LTASQAGTLTLGVFKFDSQLFGDTLGESDGGAFRNSNWLNVTNSNPGTPGALTGPTFDTGIANIGFDGPPAVYTIGYNTPIVNGSGDDLGILTARFSTNDTFQLAVSTDGTTFTPFVSFGPGLAVSTGVEKSYFYAGGGPFSAVLFVTPVDLSAFGVASGATIRAVKITSSPEGDLIRVAGFAAECQTNVTRLSQGDRRWAANLYDHSSTSTIKQEGCALTSLTMALNNAGVSTDPGSLNTFMAATDMDYSGSIVNWGPATHDASGGTLRFHAQRIDSTADFQTAKQYLDTNVCQQHHPVIVGVNLDSNGTPGHYVLITGKQNDDYTIADPGFAKTTLSEYNNKFVTRGFVADPPGDLSELNLAMGDVAETLLTDPFGRETGFDQNLQKIVEQIPTSAYFRDSLQNDVSGAPATETGHLTEIFQPTEGTYQIVVNGLKLGTYSLSLRVFSQDGSSQPGVLIPGIAGPGSSAEFSIQLTSTPGSTSTITVAATISSTLADINNSLQLGLIDNHGVANSLAQKIEAAQGATGNTRNNILKAFINEVKAQSGNHIKGVAVQVLLADANALSVR